MVPKGSSIVPLPPVTPGFTKMPQLPSIGIPSVGVQLGVTPVLLVVMPEPEPALVEGVHCA